MYINIIRSMNSSFETLTNELDIFQANINNNINNINVINTRTKNIYTENAVINDVLKYDGNNWIPSNAANSEAQSLILVHETSAENDAEDAERSREASIESKLTAQQQATIASSWAAEAATSLTDATTSATDAANFATTVSTLADAMASSATELENLSIAKANKNNPVLTGSINLPTGVTVNNIPISISNKIMSKAIRAYSKGLPDFSGSFPDNQLLHIHFHDIVANTYGTPTFGNSVSLWGGTASLWNRNLETSSKWRTYFKVPSGRGGVYQVTANILGEYSRGAGNGVKSEHYLYRRRNSVDTNISYKIFDLRDDSTTLHAGAVKYRTETIDNFFELDAGDELFIMVKIDHFESTQGTNQAFRVVGREDQNANVAEWWKTGDQTQFIVMEL